MTTLAAANTADVPSPALDLARPEFLAPAALIDGCWTLAGPAAPQLVVRDPATLAPVGAVPALGAEAATQAVEAAARALPLWSRRHAEARANILRAWGAAIRTHARDLSRILTAESGKPIKEARAEIAYAASFVDWFAEECRRAEGAVIPGHRSDARLFVLHRPVGVVAAITPWNFPAAMVTRKVAPALAAGCTVVLKPAEATPFTALALARLAEDAGLPPGVLNVVTGPPAPIGDVFTDDPRIAKLTFTGSTAVGKSLGARAMSGVKRLSLELGGNAPFIVCADADIPAAVAGALASKFRNAGQTCVCANRFYVHASVYDAFAEGLAAGAAALTVGIGASERTDIGPLINAAGRDKVARHLADALAGGARVIAGGEGPSADLHGAGAFFTPTVLTDVATDSLLTREETFGPLAGLIRVQDDAEALQLANASRAGLAAYLYTRDLDRAFALAEGLETGMVGLNTGIFSTASAPFGGSKESGVGREGGRLGLLEFLEPKTLAIGLSAPYPSSS